MSVWMIGPSKDLMVHFVVRANFPTAIGPCIGPVIGGFLTIAKGWRWNFWFVAIVVCVELRSQSDCITDLTRLALYPSCLCVL